MPLTGESLLFLFLAALVVHCGWILGSWLMGAIARLLRRKG